MVNGDEAYGISELVLSGLIRVVTYVKVFNKPSPLATRWPLPNRVRVEPGARHWGL